MMEYMRKTKRELIEIIHDIEAKCSRLEGEKVDIEATMARMGGENADLNGRLGDIRTVVDQLRAESEAAAQAMDALESEKKALETTVARLRGDQAALEEKIQGMQAEIDRLRIDGAAVHQQAAKLREKNDVITRESGEAAEARAALENALVETRERLEACESRYRSHYELFRSFVDDDRKKILLLDTAYAVIYVNRSARPVLGIGEDENIAGKRFFDFMAFKDAIKVKEKIDKAFLEGGTEKIKKIRFQCEDGGVREFKLKMNRVRYQDRPSVKIIIK